MGCHFLLQRIFLTQGSNLCLLRWQVDSLPSSHQGSTSVDRYYIFHGVLLFFVPLSFLDSKLHELWSLGSFSSSLFARSLARGWCTADTTERFVGEQTNESRLLSTPPGLRSSEMPRGFFLPRNTDLTSCWGWAVFLLATRPLHCCNNTCSVRLEAKHALFSQGHQGTQ